MIESAGMDALQRLQQLSEAMQTDMARAAREPVPDALAAEFRSLMNGDVEAVSQTRPVEGMEPTAKDATPGVDATTRSEQSVQSPADLLGLQCSLNMQLFEAKMMTSVRDHAAQDLEQTIKMNG